MDSAITPASKQSRFLEYAQMFRDPRQRHRVRSREMRDAFIASRQMCQNPASRWVGQRGKRAIQCGRGMFNHLVNYLLRVIAPCKLKIFSSSPSDGAGISKVQTFLTTTRLSDDGQCNRSCSFQQDRWHSLVLCFPLLIRG